MWGEGEGRPTIKINYQHQQHTDFQEAAFEARKKTLQRLLWLRVLTAVIKTFNGREMKEGEGREARRRAAPLGEGEGPTPEKCSGQRVIPK